MAKRSTKGVLFFIFLFLTSNIFAQTCAVPTGINTINISNFSALTTWNGDSSIHHYRLRYKELGGPTWINRNNIINTSKELNNLLTNRYYIWQVRSYCTVSNTNPSSWSVIDTFQTTNYVLDCNGSPGGTAYVDSCGNCVGGNTGKVECIPFSPSVSIVLSNTNCGGVSSLTFITSQDPNEPDISSSVFSSDGGHFNFSGLTTNDTIGSGAFIAGGGYLNASVSLLVDFIITSDKISVKAVGDSTGIVYGTFTLENTGIGILVIANAPPDNNNVTSGNSQTVVLDGIFVNPTNPSTINFTSNITSELFDIDIQTQSISIACTVDCNGVPNGSAYIDSCGNCVGGNTGAVACIPFSPTVNVSLSNTDCDSLTDLTISVS
ncbi:MAG: fibronectin type III domain-containing protein, partial [Bacteroidota bacterium]|nr:fibronectin type III domain-containing protein [Bacteroidota bacterium]